MPGACPCSWPLRRASADSKPWRVGMHHWKAGGSRQEDRGNPRRSAPFRYPRRLYTLIGLRRASWLRAGRGRSEGGFLPSQTSSRRGPGGRGFWHLSGLRLFSHLGRLPVSRREAIPRERLVRQAGRAMVERIVGSTCAQASRPHLVSPRCWAVLPCAGMRARSVPTFRSENMEQPLGRLPQAPQCGWAASRS